MMQIKMSTYIQKKELKFIQYLFLFILLFISFSHDLHAQTKRNIIQFKNNLSFFEGNVNKLDVLSQLNYEHQDSMSEFSSSYRIFYGELNNHKNNLEHQAFVNYDYNYKSILSPFIGVSSFSNEFKGFKLRNNILVGFKWLLHHSSSTTFSISSAITGEHNIFTSSPLNAVGSRSETYLFRYSFRPKLKLTFSKLELLNETFFQPSTLSLKDYIIQSRTDINFNIIKKVALLVSYIYFYNNQPAFSTLRKRDQKLMIGIEFKI